MPAGMMLAASYDIRLVVLSIAIAIVGSYVGLTLGERVFEHHGRSRFLWLAGGAISFGSAVWAMHFTGMLAFRMPIDVDYDVPLVALSLVFAMLACGAALFTVARARVTWASTLVGAALMGGGIAGMHYIGMFAMRMPAATVWNWSVIAVSVVVAVVFSIVAIRISFHVRTLSSHRLVWHRFGAAIVIGLAIAGMHYTGMAAATFAAAPAPRSSGLVISGSAVGGIAIALITLLVSGFAMTLAFFDRRFAAQDAALAQSERRLSTVVANAPVVILAFDAAGTITIAEGRTLAAMGEPAESLVGRSFFAVYEHAPELLEQARRALRGEELMAMSTLGTAVLETHWTAVRVGGEVESVVAVVTDITARRRAEVALQHLALHDALTGLPNRRFFSERLAEVMHDAARTGEPVALALIDLDRFKAINDTLGHEVGDIVLRQVAARLDSVLRSGDLVARLGGDEFAMLLPGTDTAHAQEIARRISAALEPPCMVNGNALDMPSSIGLAIAPQHGRTAENLLRKADVAMYAAKRDGGGYVLYDPSLDRLEEELRKAIQDDAFTLAYQPIFTLGGALLGCEALIRWPQTDGTIVEPDDFIPFAESTGLIVPIGAWVLRTACMQGAVWHREHPRFQLSVNVSAKQMNQQFVQTVRTALAETGLPADHLELEFTESAASSNNDRSAAVVSELRGLGIHVAIDDFGTGYNSLETLRCYGVDTLKLDRCFVSNIVENPVDRAIAAAAVTAAHALGARVVAEGIETPEQLAALAALHVDCGQGHLLGRPLSPNDFDRLLGGTLAGTAARSNGAGGRTAVSAAQQLARAITA